MALVQIPPSPLLKSRRECPKNGHSRFFVHFAILIKLSNSGHNLLNKDSVRVFVPLIAISKVRVTMGFPFGINTNSPSGLISCAFFKISTASSFYLRRIDHH